MSRFPACSKNHSRAVKSLDGLTPSIKLAQPQRTESVDKSQLELFPALAYVDLSLGMTARSTRSKTPPKRRKAIAPAKENDRLSIAQTYT
jgi:hypothetical protein